VVIIDDAAVLSDDEKVAAVFDETRKAAEDTMGETGDDVMDDAVEESLQIFRLRGPLLERETNSRDFPVEGPY